MQPSWHVLRVPCNDESLGCGQIDRRPDQSSSARDYLMMTAMNAKHLTTAAQYNGSTGRTTIAGARFQHAQPTRRRTPVWLLA